MKSLFVLMPFNEDFDDVYHIIKDSGNQASQDCKVELKVHRADDISSPGRISIQVLEAIRESDMIVADLTGSNPNVMYELGYAHALNKTVVLLNQAIHQSPFDVKDFRQITYDRTKLLRDCRPRLVTAINSVIENGHENKSINETEAQSSEGNVSSIFRRPGASLVAELQETHIELQISNKLSNKVELRKVGDKLRKLIDTVTIVGKVDSSAARNTAGSMGNCAVELEKGEEYRLAEEIFNRAIGLFPDHVGLRIQYSDFLFDQGREEEARTELSNAKEINQNDPLIPRLEIKFSAQGSNLSDEVGRLLKQKFEEDPSDHHKAAAYLIFLSKTENSEQAFEDACDLWGRNIHPSEIITPKRALADFFATRNLSRAISIYESIISDKDMSASDKHDALHNMATLYSGSGDKESAMKCWTEAYSIDRNDPTVKAAFSQRLASWGEFEKAQNVIRGLPIE